MALQKQSVNVNFGQGLDTKSDPLQVQPGKFLELTNTVFNKGGQLKKRNGYQPLVPLNDAQAKSLASYKDSLVAVGSNLYRLSEESNAWVNTGRIQPAKVRVRSIARSSTSQTSPDIAIALSGLACTTYSDSSGTWFYKIVDQSTGQAVIQPVSLPSTAAQARVSLLGNYFVVTFLVLVSSTPHLQAIAIPVSNANQPSAIIDLSSLVKDMSAGYDVISVNNNLYFAYNASDAGSAVRVGYLDSGLTQHTPILIAGKRAQLVSLAADTAGTTPVIWLSYWTSTGNTGFSQAFTPDLTAVLAPTQTITGTLITQLTSVAASGVMTLLAEVSNSYSYSGVSSDYVRSVTCTQTGVVGTASIVIRSVGLASKAFFINKQIYFLTSYSGSYQPTYFLIDSLGLIVAKLAYANGAGYNTTQILSNVVVNGNVARFSYVHKDLLVSVNKSQGVTSNGGTYSQTGINLAEVEITNDVSGLEIGNNLHLTGGMLWMFDGSRPVEHGFHLWPEDVALTSNLTGGSMAAQDYYYQAVYEWTDAQGNIHRSAPSIAMKVTTTGSTSSVTVTVPTLRLTQKSTVRIVLYRWSTAQQNFYQITSITSPIANDKTVDQITYTDTKSDSQIIGNPLVYTTGGIIENIGAPATNIMTLFKSRLFCVDAEDPDLIWFSKQVIDATPAEMSDLLTIYVAPTIAAQGSTGPITALSSMDDKLIIFKKNAIYYVTGQGPDNSGSYNDFADPVFITSTVGCSNPKSIVMTPSGLMFQSDKGIWILGRDLATSYIGAAVENYNGSTVNSALTVPGTNQVRFTISTGLVLMYDYFFGQWGTFSNVPAVASSIYGGLHTYLDPFGRVLQEKPGVYKDGTNPVLMSFLTSWFALGGLLGYQRFYQMNFLGKYLSPHLLSIKFFYDYNPYALQTVMVYPQNYSAPYGYETAYGSGIYGGTSAIEDWQIFPVLQKCESFQIKVEEFYDSSVGQAAGEGLTLSGLNLVLGLKKGYRPNAASTSAG